MNASGMLAHVNDSYRMALGDLYVKPKNLPLRYPPLKQFVIYAMPFPKGAPTSGLIYALEGPFQSANGWLRGTQRGRLFPSQPAAVPPD